MTLVVAWCAVGPAQAEPYMAVREGLRCNACHVNGSGGGMRKQIVSAHARDILRYPDFVPWLSRGERVFPTEIASMLRVGANLRASAEAVFQELESGRVSDNDAAFRGRLEEVNLDVTEAVLYAEAALLDDGLTLYIDQRVAPQTDAREVWARLRLPHDLYLKAGRMFLPYGLQLQDDTAFIRGGRNGSATTGFSFNEKQAGFAVAWEPEAVGVRMAVTQGGPRDRDVQVTATVMRVWPEVPGLGAVLLGGSASRVDQVRVFGFFGGFTVPAAWLPPAWLGAGWETPLSVLAEADLRSDRRGGEWLGTFLGYAEADWLLFDWLNLKVAFDYADDDGDLSSRSNDSENRFTIGLEPFWSRFLQTRLIYRVSNGVRAPSVGPRHNQSLWLLEVHVFL